MKQLVVTYSALMVLKVPRFKSAKSRNDIDRITKEISSSISTHAWQ